MPDMREKVKEYIGELETEIQRCIELEKMESIGGSLVIWARIEAPTEVKNDLKNRLEEVI